MNVIHEVTSPRRQRARQVRTDRIAEAALAIVAEGGFDALTMGRLADDLDLSAGALYRYFPSKDHLVVALQSRAVERLALRLGERRASWRSSLPPEAAVAALGELLAVAAFYRALADDEPRVFRLVSAALGDLRIIVDDDARALEAAGPLVALFVEVGTLFESAAQTCALGAGDAAERTAIFWSALHGALLLGKLNRLAPRDAAHPNGLFHAPTLGRATARTLLSGWGASADDLDAADRWLLATTAAPVDTHDTENRP